MKPLATPWRDLAEALVEREVLGEPVLQLDPLDLGPLVAQHAEADGHVGRVAGQVRDTLGDGGDVGVTSGIWSSCLVGSTPAFWHVRAAGRPLRSVYKSITSVKQLQAFGVQSVPEGLDRGTG